MKDRYVKGMKLKLDAYDLYKKVRKDYLKSHPDADRVPSDSDLHKLIYEVYLYGNGRTIGQISSNGQTTSDAANRSRAGSNENQYGKEYNSANPEPNPDVPEHGDPANIPEHSDNSIDASKL